VRRPSAVTLGVLRDRSATDTLLEIAVNEREEEWLRFEAAKALGAIGEKRAVPTLVLIAQRDARRRTLYSGVIQALAWLKDPRARETLIAALNHPDPVLRGDPTIREAAEGGLKDLDAVAPNERSEGQH